MKSYKVLKQYTDRTSGATYYKGDSVTPTTEERAAELQSAGVITKTGTAAPAAPGPEETPTVAPEETNTTRKRKGS